MSFWNDKDIAANGFEQRYQIDKHSLLLGYFNNDMNFTQMQMKCGVKFDEIVKLYTKHFAHSARPKL